MLNFVNNEEEVKWLRTENQELRRMYAEAKWDNELKDLVITHCKDREQRLLGLAIPERRMEKKFEERGL